MDAKELRHHELIGLKVKILECSDHRMIGRSGRIVNETKDLLVIKGEEEFKVPKDNCVFQFLLRDRAEKIVIEGSEIVGQPHKRLKK